MELAQKKNNAKYVTVTCELDKTYCHCGRIVTRASEKCKDIRQE